MSRERITRISNRPRQLPSAGTTKISAHDLRGCHFSSRVNAARSFRVSVQWRLIARPLPTAITNRSPARRFFVSFLFFIVVGPHEAHVKTAFNGTRYGPVRVRTAAAEIMVPWNELCRRSQKSPRTNYNSDGIRLREQHARGVGGGDT